MNVFFGWTTAAFNHFQRLENYPNVIKLGLSVFDYCGLWHVAVTYKLLIFNRDAEINKEINSNSFLKVLS